MEILLCKKSKIMMKMMKMMKMMIMKIMMKIMKILMMMNKKRTRKKKMKTTNLQNRIRKINNDFYIYFHCNKTSSIHDSIPINYYVS